MAADDEGPALAAESRRGAALGRNWDTSGTRQPDPLIAIMVGKFEKSSWRGEHDAEQAVNQDAGCFRTGGVFVMLALGGR